MSHSVPSDSSYILDTPPSLAADLVVFVRERGERMVGLPSLWSEAGHEASLWGASLDRLLGESEEHVLGAALVEEPRELGRDLEDALVLLRPLDGSFDGACPAQAGFDPGLPAAQPADLATVYDAQNPSHFLLAVHDGWNCELAKPDWVYDHHL